MTRFWQFLKKKTFRQLVRRWLLAVKVSCCQDNRCQPSVVSIRSSGNSSHRDHDSGSDFIGFAKRCSSLLCTSLASNSQDLNAVNYNSLGSVQTTAYDVHAQPKQYDRWVVWYPAARYIYRTTDKWHVPVRKSTDNTDSISPKCM